ncbi:Cleavage and polyadenylation specificity factor 73 [Orchesella cincta]|uniref:Cleavage and polyadenylation specificity factor 73 n=1 Tax=Orchesella cincta TaxID=48709 RepID=A0A1D2M808_ORCCI|nr:Cleavage and polyadenylation specificity factor 73 [Orchesella cincta]
MKESTLTCTIQRTLRQLSSGSKGEKMAKVMGALAVENQSMGSGSAAFSSKGTLTTTSLIAEYTDLNMSVVTQRQSICFSGSFDLLHHMLVQLAKEVEVMESKGKDKRVIRVFGVIDVVYEKGLVTVEWVASPVNDMFADAALTAILQADSIEVHPNDFPPPPDTDRDHFKVCFIMRFMRDEIYETFKGDTVAVVVDGKTATIDFGSLEVTCDDDESLQQVVQSAVSRLHNTLTPIRALSAT